MEWPRGTQCRLLLGAVLVAAGPAYVAPSHAEADRAAAIADIVRSAIAKYDLRAVIVRVTIDGKVVTTQAFGESMSGDPATPDMHFRNGNVAFAYHDHPPPPIVDEKQHHSRRQALANGCPTCRTPIASRCGCLPI